MGVSRTHILEIAAELVAAGASEHDADRFTRAEALDGLEVTREGADIVLRYRRPLGWLGEVDAGEARAVSLAIALDQVGAR